MKNIPQKIYLQVDPENDHPDDFKELGEVTWCQDQINDTDIEYHLKKFDENEKCIKIIKAIRDLCNQEKYADKRPVISFAQDWGNNSLTVFIDGVGHSHIGEVGDEINFDQLIDSLYDMLCENRGLSFVKEKKS